MRIRFETTFEDVIAFNLFHYGNSPTWRRQVWIQVLVIPMLLAAVFGLICVMIFVVDPNPQETGPFVFSILMLFLVASFVWITAIQRYMKRSLASKTRQFLSEGPSNQCGNDWYEMEIANSRLLVDRKYLQQVFDLRAIERILSNENYTFIYISAISAFVIPTDPQYPERLEFVAEIEEAWKNRESLPILRSDLAPPVADDRIMKDSSRR